MEQHGTGSNIILFGCCVMFSGDNILSTRDRTREILDIRQRGSRSDTVPFDLEALQREWSKHRHSEACVPDFYVIRLVTLLEVFTRGNIDSLIDYEKKYTDRAIKL